MNQPNQTVPPPAQVPDPRLEQIMGEMRQLREQNQALRGQVDYMARQTNPATKAPEQKPVFEPNVEKALDQKFQSLLSPVMQQQQQTIGFLMDRVDQTEFTAKYRQSNYAEFLPQVEQMVEQNKFQNRWVPREQLLQLAYFEATGKKTQQPQPPPVETKSQPTYNTYLNQWVDPATGQVVAQPAPDSPPQAPQAVNVPVAAMPLPSPLPQNQQWVPQQAQPTPGAPQLAPATPPPSTMRVAHSPVASNLQLGSSDQDLERWASQYGDIPL